MTVAVDPLALVYAGIQLYKLYNDDRRFALELEDLRARNLDAAGVLRVLNDMRVKAAEEAHAAVERMAE